MPNSSARATIFSMMEIFSFKFLGSPSSDSGKRTNIAPYFFANGSSFSNFSDSNEIELISARPG